MQIVSLVVAIFAMLISAGAFCVAILNFRRDRSFVNENYFHQYKIEQYGEIIRIFTEATEEIWQTLLVQYGDLQQAGRIKREVMDDDTDRVDEKMENVSLMLGKACAFIPTEIVERLDALYERISDTLEYFYSEKLTKRRIEDWFEQCRLQEEELDGIINLMRKDIGIETLEKRLRNRIHGKK